MERKWLTQTPIGRVECQFTAHWASTAQASSQITTSSVVVVNDSIVAPPNCRRLPSAQGCSQSRGSGGQIGRSCPWSLGRAQRGLHPNLPHHRPRESRSAAVASMLRSRQWFEIRGVSESQLSCYKAPSRTWGIAIARSRREMHRRHRDARNCRFDAKSHGDSSSAESRPSRVSFVRSREFPARLEAMNDFEPNDRVTRGGSDDVFAAARSRRSNARRR